MGERSLAGRISLFCNAGSRSAAPTGLRPPAQGCEEQATLGTRGESSPTPTGLWPASSAARHNPVGVGNHFHAATQGSPLGAGNPGLEDTAPLGLKFRVRVARN